MQSRLPCLFNESRKIRLHDGRTLVVMYQGERYGWGAYVPGETARPTSEPTPAQAIAPYLDAPVESLPLPIREFCERLEEEFHAAPRYECECCGFKTLLNPGHYDICDVCWWEDDRPTTARRGPDAPSGPNRISLRDARANFRASGASKDRFRHLARAPRPEEFPEHG